MQNWRAIADIVHWVLVGVDAILLGWFVYFLRRGFKLRPRFKAKQQPRERRARLSGLPEIRQAWTKILEKAEDSSNSGILAVIEADTLTDSILKRLEIPGDTMAERLAKLDARELPHLLEVGRAHRIRNALVHKPDFSVSASQKKELLATYESFLKDLEILD